MQAKPFLSGLWWCQTTTLERIGLIPDRNILLLESLCGDPLFEVGLFRLMNSSAVISQLLDNARRFAATTYLDITCEFTFQEKIATAAVDRIHAIATYDYSLTRL